MEQKQHHYTGLTDAEVLASRQKHGVNILTPPEEESTWDKIKDCMHYWLIKLILGLFVASIAAIIILNVTGVEMPTNVWIGPVILVVLFFLTYLVAYLGGDWDDEERKFDMDPLITILLAALVLSGAISFYQGVFGGEAGFTPYFEPVGIAFAVLLATGVAHVLEARNEKTFKALNEVNDETLVKVIRNNNVCQVERKDIVVGDIVLLNTGEEVPADCKLLEAEHLKLNESSLTGEPSCHKTTNEADFDKEATYPSNHIMKGTTILVGNCVAEVFAVGDKTACGKVFEAAQVREGDPTPLSQKLDGLADLITKASYIIAGLIIIGRIAIYFIQGNADFATTEGTVGFIKYVLDTIMIAVTLIVVAVPEGLPMAVTLSLAFSMRRLMEQNTLPRTMHACETMGATSVICTDKTGTLTQNQMQIAETFFPEDTDMKLVEESISVNTTANLDYSDPNKIKAIGSPTEGALLLWLHEQGKNYLDQREMVERLDRIPFSTEIKYMATIVRSAVTGKRTMYVTGAPDILLAMCGDKDNKDYNERLVAYQSKALRTLGLACAEIGDDNVIADGKPIDTSKMKMLGVVAISDPIRKEVPAAIKECISAGIKVKIVTGDTVGTAKEIGRQVGLWSDKDTDKNILTGAEVAAMSDEELKSRLAEVKIISRARPNDKERVVRTLKAMDEVVAVTGDGTNDAPALNAAHVGLSMGDGTAVAKEASDMTILDNSFSTIANAVMWGRSLYKNIKRFILFQMTVNVTACFIVLVGAFIGTESPLTVTQMLWVNLIMDTFAALALASLPPTHAVMKEKPRSIDEHILKGISKPILGVGLTFAFICLAMLLYFQHAVIEMPPAGSGLVGAIKTLFGGTLGAYNEVSPHELGLFFTVFVMLHFWYMFNAKAHFTTSSAFKGISWDKTRWFIIITSVIFFVQIALIEVPGLQEMFNVAKGGLGFMNWVIILVLTSLVVWIGEITRPFKKKQE
ncbi:MAG: Ca2+-transporting ATPase [bacterium P3]|nr:MAG: Ca2+-transporting ATPase [bacterium P3]KWW41813.1 MAG: Calcium-translocating P-type ATPase, PMCA-type [bacterium F083]